MKCVCPKCGRNNDVSAAELQKQRGVVVCPKCLTTFRVKVTVTADDNPPPVPKRRTKSLGSAPAQKPTAKVRYCNQCGTPIPAGGIACPQCGHRVGSAAPATTGGRRKPITFTGEQPRGRSTTATQRRPAATAPARPVRKAPAKKSKSSGESLFGSMTTLGCIGYSALLTAVFFALYFFFGVLFN